MNLGFFIILGSQFLSALADNALFIAALALLREKGAPEWHLSMLLWSFTVSYVILAPVAGTFADVWGKFVVVAYTKLGSLQQRGVPSYGYTYRLGGFPIVEPAYEDRNAKSWIYPVTDEVAPVIAGATAGYLISAAVA